MFVKSPPRAVTAAERGAEAPQKQIQEHAWAFRRRWGKNVTRRGLDHGWCGFRRRLSTRVGLKSKFSAKRDRRLGHRKRSSAGPAGEESATDSCQSDLDVGNALGASAW